MYDVGDIVGIKIADVDRSNTAPSILPVKIIEKQIVDDSLQVRYRVTSDIGIIADTYLPTDLIDLTDTVSLKLRRIDHTVLPLVSFIQASKHFTNFRTISACKCNGLCDTIRCPCKSRGIVCCNKCHRGKQTSCKNRS